MKLQHFGGLATLVVLAAVGCGGANGGLGNGGSPLGGSALAPVSNLAAKSGIVNSFVTSSPNNRYSHVWTTLYSVSLKSAKGSVTVFSSSKGQVVDLATMRNSAGQKFAFVSKAAIPGVSFNNVEVNVGRTMQVITAGSSKATARQLAPEFNIAKSATLSKISIPLFKPVAGTGTHNLVVDFNLHGMSINSQGKLIARAQQGSENGVDSSGQQESEDFEGLVSALSGTAPAFTFTLGNLTVNTDANTVIFNEDGSPNPVLANAERVKVYGIVTNGVVAASQIKIENSQTGDGGEAEAHGTVASFDGVNFTIGVNVDEADGFVPTSTTVTVNTTSNTIFFIQDGSSLSQADFFTALANAPANSRIEIKGAFDGTNFNATEVKVEYEGNGSTGGGDGGGDGAPHRRR